MSGVDQRKTAMVQQGESHESGRGRYLEGWRAGKPSEDPEKLKRWGRVSARPSEYLIHMRAGKVRTSSSGQGASCFKFPSDAVAVVPTTVQKLRFSADQVTREKVGVEVTGLAVYRIAEPLIAFRMLNFSFPERAQQKLEEMLVEMFAGASRRLVANLTVDECLSRRKEGIAAELMREIAPVVSGHGRIDDETDMGWGVVIDTIEIQDVRILSSTVFSNMQARYRQTQELEAREAALTTERAVKLGEAEATRRIELTQLAATTEVQSRRQEAEEAARLGEIAATARVMEAKLAQKRATEEAEIETGRVVLLAKIESERLLAERRRFAAEQQQAAELAIGARLAEARLAEEQRAAEQRLAIEVARAQLEAEVEAARHAASLARIEHELAHLRLQAEISSARRAIAESEVAIAEIAARQAILAQEPELARARALREIENSVSPEAVRLVIAQRMPDLAAAFQQNMGHVNVTAIGGENPFGFVVAAVDGVLGMARAAGLDLPLTRDRTSAS
jgi:flotillin